MAKCMSCGKTILLTSTFGNVVLCKNCGTLSNVSAWSRRDFSSVEELIAMKNDSIQRASAGNISQDVITEIVRYFDEYIDNGFITTINGRAGQTLKVFSDYCIVTTKNERKKEDLEDKFEDNDDVIEEDDDDSVFSPADKMNIAKGLMSGKIVQTGIGAVMSAKLNQQEKEKTAERKAHERERKIERLISVGERRIDLINISSVEMSIRNNSSNGYLRFIPKGVATSNIYNCEYFFFNNSIPFESKKIKKSIENIKNIINGKIANIDRQRAIEQEENDRKQMHIEQQIPIATKSDTDSFEEIRKFKELLDEGIISEEEFNIKKKELLGL